MGSKILLADDSITIQKVVNLTFADEGIEVVAVNNGDVAERRMDEVRPDLVLADIFMPGKNGYELCESIKNSQFRNVPVVLLVGAFEPFDQAEARRVRADAHLTKPFESRTLVETVRKLINATAQPTGGPVPAPVPMIPAAGELRDDTRDDIRSDRDTGSIPARLTSSSTPRIDLSAMMPDTGAPSTASTRSAAELSSRLNDWRPEALEVSIAGAPAREAVTATLIDTDEPFGTMEFSSAEFTSGQFSSSLSLDTTEPILDFETSERFESTTHQDTISFDTEPGEILEVDVNRLGGEAQGLERNSVDNAKLDISSPGDVVWNDGVDVSQANPQATLPKTSGETAFEAPNESLLTVEEPLGNLLDEIPLPVHDTSSTDSLSLGLTEVGAADTVPASTQFDLVDSAPPSSSEASNEGEEQAKEHQTPRSHRVADWTTPRAGAYSTAQLDSVVMPIETAAYLARNSFEEAARSEVSQGTTFSSPAKWTEEEARFTAIDIEATSVEEPDANAETSVAAEAVRSATEPANGASATSELSAAAIEEIVRRVIAEMSDSVVREVAWEVVPDCVERVVDQLTRESLSKPT